MINAQPRSEVAAMHAQIELECRALFYLSSFKHIGSHDFVAARYAALDEAFKKLEGEIGTGPTIDFLCGTYDAISMEPDLSEMPACVSPRVAAHENC